MPRKTAGSPSTIDEMRLVVARPIGLEEVADGRSAARARAPFRGETADRDESGGPTDGPYHFST